MKSLPHSAAKDVFAYLLAFSMLYVGVVSFITLLFQYIEIKFPDVLDGWHQGNLDVIRTSMATLLVVWPVCILVNHFIDKDRLVRNGNTEAGIRKWLIYLTLFVTAITLVVDLITLINYFLNGEITTRFVLKVIVVLITIGAVFWFELWDLKHPAKETAEGSKKIGALSLVVMVVAVVGGFFLVGTPAEQRKVRLDDQRVSDLSNIQFQVIDHYQRTQALPTSLDALTNDITGYVAPVDPETGASYQYSVIQPGADAEPLNDHPTFELCADFNLASQTALNASEPMMAYSYPGLPYEQNWNHTAGRACFDRTIDPDFYPDFYPMMK